jgi:hypothetical protein
MFNHTLQCTSTSSCTIINITSNTITTSHGVDSKREDVLFQKSSRKEHRSRVSTGVCVRAPLVLGGMQPQRSLGCKRRLLTLGLGLGRRRCRASRVRQDLSCEGWVGVPFCGSVATGSPVGTSGICGTPSCSACSIRGLCEPPTPHDTRHATRTCCTSSSSSARMASSSSSVSLPASMFSISGAGVCEQGRWVVGGA